jgi:hypothetical protein
MLGAERRPRLDPLAALWLAACAPARETVVQMEARPTTFIAFAEGAAADAAGGRGSKRKPAGGGFTRH